MESKTQELLFSLCENDCIIGNVMDAATVAMKEVKKYSSEAYFDRYGNIIAPIKKPKNGGMHLMLEAHIDQIGFVVTNIDADGFLHVGRVGGPDMRILLGNEVTVHAKKGLFGVFCCRPPHLSSSDDYKKVPSEDEIAIDIGFDAEKAKELVSPGDYVTLARRPSALLNGYVTGKSIDNRAGVAVMLRSLELLAGQLPDIGLTVLFALSEELGERGAKTGAFAVNPTHAIVVDVSYGYTPDSPREKCGDLKKGPMIGISPVLSREMTDRFFEIAKEKGIPYQTEVMSEETGTDSDAVSITREGVKTGLLSVPLRYMHTSIEMIAIEDLENTAAVIAEYIKTAGRKQK